MTSMIERVARAICASNRVPEADRDLAWTAYIDDARAAIEAMREPTDAMQIAVSAQWGRRTWSQYNDVIDAALKES